MDVQDALGAVNEDDHAVHLEPLAEKGEPGVERDVHLVARRVDEGARELGEELLEPQAVPQVTLAGLTLPDDRGQAHQGHSDDPDHALEREGRFPRRETGQEPVPVDGRPQRDGGHREEGEAGAGGSEPDRTPEQGRQEQDERQSRQPPEGLRFGGGGGEDQDGHHDRGEGEEDGLAYARHPGTTDRRRAALEQHHDRGDADELGQRVREESVAPHRPEVLAALRAHDPRVRERRKQRSHQHRPHEEHRHPSQGVEATRPAVEAVHARRGQDGFAAVRHVQGEDHRPRPTRPELHGEMRRKRRREVDPPPAARRGQEESGGEDRVGRPEDGRRLGGDAEDEAEQRAEVVRHGDGDGQGGGPRSTVEPGTRRVLRDGPIGLGSALGADVHGARLRPRPCPMRGPVPERRMVSDSGSDPAASYPTKVQWQRLAAGPTLRLTPRFEDR